MLLIYFLLFYVLRHMSIFVELPFRKYNGYGDRHVTHLISF